MKKELIVKSWKYVNIKIPYSSIISYTGNKNILNSPALSFDRITIKYRVKQSYHILNISPVNKECFIEHLGNKIANINTI